MNQELQEATAALDALEAEHKAIRERIEALEAELRELTARKKKLEGSGWYNHGLLGDARDAVEVAQCPMLQKPWRIEVSGKVIVLRLNGKTDWAWPKYSKKTGKRLAFNARDYPEAPAKIDAQEALRVWENAKGSAE